jgi:hypothetical protein
MSTGVNSVWNTGIVLNFNCVSRAIGSTEAPAASRTIDIIELQEVVMVPVLGVIVNCGVVYLRHVVFNCHVENTIIHVWIVHFEFSFDFFNL